MKCTKKGDEQSRAAYEAHDKVGWEERISYYYRVVAGPYHADIDSGGANGDECANYYEVSVLTVRPGISGLAKRKLLVATGTTRESNLKRQARVYVWHDYVAVKPEQQPQRDLFAR
jgi:hypothetical protein